MVRQGRGRGFHKPNQIGDVGPRRAGSHQHAEQSKPHGAPQGGQAAGNTKEPFVFYGAVALIYLGFTSLSELAFRWLEQRYSIGTREGQL